ncbi:uncharacterized protein L3040_005960 [Drepanopeziza brunnea f. sp. 'multigermtubi']|uniref:uncharacterized protein n=1 Tax=Drepanopeziza brunnea f. sp. 'multigermtubi' TaxID=698441 RepID=UPI00239B22D0|nr:hypothetical protein L3040_005960 [Drepanopeziza brunnea f. sp. 'multigermtubi']
MEGCRPRPMGSPSRAIIVPNTSTAASSPTLNSPSMGSAAPNPSSLSRSPFFRTKLENLSSELDLPVVHIVADPVHFKIVARWMTTNGVLNGSGRLPNLNTLCRLAFLADRLDLWELVGQLLSMVKAGQFEGDGSKAPSHAEMYQHTRPGNPFRNYAAVDYAKRLSVGSPAPGLSTNLPAAMLIDVVNILVQHHQQLKNEAEALKQKIQSLQSDIQGTQEKNEAEKQKFCIEAELNKEVSLKAKYDARYNAKLSEALASMKSSIESQFNAKIVQAKKDLEDKHAKDLEKYRQASVNPSSSRTGQPGNQADTTANFEKQFDERYQKLVKESNERNLEHSVAVAELEKTYNSKITRLQKEIAILKSNADPGLVPVLEHPRAHSEEADSRTMGELAQALKESQAETMRLKKSEDQSEAKINELSQNILDAESTRLNEIEALRATIEANEARSRNAIADAESRCAEAKRLHQDYQIEIAALETAAVLLQNPNPGSDGSHRKKSQQGLDEPETAITALEAKYTQLERAYNDLADDKENEVAELHRKLIDCEERNRLEVEHIQKLLDDIRQRSESDLAAQKMMMESTDEQARRRISGLQNKKNEMQATIDRLQKEVDDLKGEEDGVKGEEAQKRKSLKRSSEEAAGQEPSRDGGSNKRGRSGTLPRR